MLAPTWQTEGISSGLSTEANYCNSGNTTQLPWSTPTLPAAGSHLLLALPAQGTSGSQISFQGEPGQPGERDPLAPIANGIGAWGGAPWGPGWISPLSLASRAGKLGLDLWSQNGKQQNIQHGSREACPQAQDRSPSYQPEREPPCSCNPGLLF